MYKILKITHKIKIYLINSEVFSILVYENESLQETLEYISYCIKKEILLIINEKDYIQSKSIVRYSVEEWE